MKRLVSLLIALAVTLVSASAFAKTSDTLLRHVPHDTRILIGMEIPKLKKSFLFAEALEVLRDQTSGKNVLSFVLAREAFDLEKDIDSMLVALNEAPTNPQSAQAPASVVVLNGKFDQKKVLGQAGEYLGKLKKTTKGKLEIHSAAGIDLAFVAKDTLVIADQGSYSRATWAAAKDPKKAASANKDLSALRKLVPGGQGLWVTMDTKGLSTGGNSPPMDGAAVGIGVASGMSLDFRSKFQKEKDAKAALEQFESMKKQSGNDPLIMMLGAKPLLDNLNAKVENKTVLAMKTSLTNDELKSLIAKVKAMAKNPPSPATGGPTTAPTQGPTSNPPTDGKGADADFN